MSPMLFLIIHSNSLTHKYVSQKCSKIINKKTNFNVVFLVFTCIFI